MDIVGNYPEIKYVEARQGDIKDSLADISRAKEAFGYEPMYDLDKGLRATVEWFESQSRPEHLFQPRVMAVSTH
jgi:UDP-glucose 4-epimerase